MAIEVLSEINPMTVRQVYYQLVSRQVCKNTLAIVREGEDKEREGFRVVFAELATDQ